VSNVPTEIAVTGAEETFGSAEVARAAGLRRNTLDTWLARRYLPLPAGPGTGRARTYTLLDAVRAAAMVHLTSIGVTPARAGQATTAIGRVPMPGDTLIITADPISSTSLAACLDAGIGGPTEADIQAVGCHIVISDSDGNRLRPPGRYQLDLFAVAEQVRRGLRDPDWRPDMAQIEARQYDQHVVLHLPNTESPQQQPAPDGTQKRRTRRTGRK
jgi:hypothetical protein